MPDALHLAALIAGLAVVAAAVALLVLEFRASSGLLSEGFQEVGGEKKPTLGVVSMMRDPKDVRRWVEHHLSRGVSRFYVRLETPDGNADAAARELSSFPQVTLRLGRPTDAPSVSDADDVPGQAQMLRQRGWVAEAIKLAQRDGIEFIAHIDSDELLECSSDDKNCDLPAALAAEVAAAGGADTKTLVLPNYEALYGPERLATALAAAATASACFDRPAGFRECAQGHCASYANGKAIGRVSEHLRESGVHRFRYAGPGRDAAVDPASKLRVLHFESCDFAQYVDKFRKLAGTESLEFPFPYYNESIAVARGPACSDGSSTQESASKSSSVQERTSSSIQERTCVRGFADVYRRYRGTAESRRVAAE